MSMVLLILLLVLGGIAAWLAERINTGLPRWIALASCTLALLYLASMVAGSSDDYWSLTTDPRDGGSWLLHLKLDWIPRFGISLELGMDGLSLLLVTLTLLLGLVAIVSSWNEISFKNGLFQANLMWTLAGVCGVFLALDLVLFFLFWEVMLIPMYLLIAIWGHENKAYAAMKFFIFTQVSGLLMLLAILVLAWQAAAQNGALSFSYFDLLGTVLEPRLAFWIMLGFFLAFCVKLPAFPFHTWLPDAHTQAPTAGSVLLAGILLKTGAYGLLRFCFPLFPDASLQFAPIAMGMGVAGVIYGAILAFAQTDFKRLVAYSSVSHMGFVLLGLYAWNSLALQGAVMQMVAHGVSTAALFMLAGALQHRLHTRDMNRMGGLWHQAPRMGACAMFFAVASLGLPGLGHFVAEFLVLAGLFIAHPITAAVAALGLITAAIYSLWMMQQTFQGEPRANLDMADFGAREMTAMAAMMVALVWLGVYPQPVLDMAQPVLDGLQALVSGQTQLAVVSPMSSIALQPLLPLLVLAAGTTLIMLQIAFRRWLAATVGLSVLTLLLAALACGYALEQGPVNVTVLLRADDFGLLFCVLFCLAAALTCLLSTDYLAQRGDQPEEYFLLLLLSTLGACVLAYATHLASLLLGLELLSVALYALIAYPDKVELPLEAATKYLVLSGAASATALFGFALLYAVTGTMEFTAMADKLVVGGDNQALLLVAAAMIVSGLAFKLSLVPFHMWTPDVYEGAPSPVTGFLATVSKAAVFVVLLRWFLEADLFRFTILVQCTALIAILSMLGGNLLALMQVNLKRMLAYSSIAHMGYLLIIFMVAVNPEHRSLAVEAACFYLIAYTATTLAAFGLLALLGAEQSGREHCQLQDVSGLFWRHPLLACLLLVAMLSLAGIPLTAGFLAKFYIIGAAVSGYHWVLLASLVIGSALAIYYYLRVVFYMTRRPGEHDPNPVLPGGWQPRLVSGILIVTILVLGVFPQPLMEYLRSIL